MITVAYINVCFTDIDSNNFLFFKAHCINPRLLLLNVFSGIVFLGTDVGPLPKETGLEQHCIATSSVWFKRRQTIDLLKNGIVPDFYDNPDLMIYICEW